MSKKTNNPKTKDKNNQNKRYEYFKQKSSNKKKSFNGKAALKRTWKFLRIFIYAALLTVSLTGCIQSFVVKVDSYTGRGMELYNKTEQVAPHVVTLLKSADKKYPVYTNDPKNNYWLKDRTALAAMHKQIKADGGNIATWKTRNEALRIVNANNQNINPKIISNNSKGYLLAGISQKRYVRKSSGTIIKLYDKNPASLTKGQTSKLVSYQIQNSQVFDISDATQKNKTEKIDSALRFDAVFYLNKNITPGPAKVDFKGPNLAAAKKYNISINSLLRTLGVAGVDHSTTAKSAIHGQPPIVTTTHFLKIAINKKTSVLFFTGSPLRPIVTLGDAWSLGPFYGLFVWPLSKLTLSLEGAFPYLNGWESIIIIGIAVLVIRTIAYALTFKSTLQQVKQQELSAKKATIESKYAPYKGNKQMDRRKQQEVMELYKKEGISPMGAIGGIFLTMPLFLAMWRIIGGIPHFKSTLWLGISFASTSYKELFAGSFQYLPLMVVAALVQAFSQIFPRLLTRKRDKNRINVNQKKAMKKQNRTQNIMLVVFVVMALIFSAGIQIYWVFGGLYTIGQNYVNHKIIQSQSRRKKSKRVKS